MDIILLEEKTIQHKIEKEQQMEQIREIYQEPNAIWCSDITYIWTYSGFIYLISIMDLFSRKITAWVSSDTLEAKHVVEVTEGWIKSYSKKAYPWDNACIESFHALIKREWIVRLKV